MLFTLRSYNVITVLYVCQTRWHQLLPVILPSSLRRTQGAALPVLGVGCALLLPRLQATYVFKQVDIHDALCEIMWLLSLPDVHHAAARLSLAVGLIVLSHQLQFANSLLSA